MLTPIHSTMLELITEQRLREARQEFERLRLLASVRAERGVGLRGALASALVRWGLRLDPAAGERLRNLALAPVASKGRKAS